MANQPRETTAPLPPQVEIDKPQVVEEGTALAVLLKDDQFLKDLEQGVTNYKKFVILCYRMTRESHWVNHGTRDAPKYSLQGPGAEALMTPLDISYGKPDIRKVELEDERGKFYAYWCEGIAESKRLRRQGWYIGYCDSRDQFFNKRPGWNPVSGEGDVRKSALTNWEVNAVSRLAGIRDPDPAMLEAAGLKPALIPAIEYSRGGDRTPEQSGGAISERQAARLWAIAKNHGVTADRVKVYLGARFHLAHTKDIKIKDYNGIVAWAEAGGTLAEDDQTKYEAWAKSLAGEAKGNGPGNGQEAGGDGRAG